MFKFLKNRPKKETREEEIDRKKKEMSKWIACKDIEKYNCEDFYFAERFVEISSIGPYVCEWPTFRCMITKNICKDVDCKRCLVSLKQQETRAMFPEVDIRKEGKI
jgi:hypothetical protein